MSHDITNKWIYLVLVVALHFGQITPNGPERCAPQAPGPRSRTVDSLVPGLTPSTLSRELEDPGALVEAPLPPPMYVHPRHRLNVHGRAKPAQSLQNHL